MTPGSIARKILRKRREGALATLSLKFDGYPFASSVAYLTDHNARPILFISTLAEHTRNIAHDPRVSLLVQEHDGEPQAAARLTLLGTAIHLADQDKHRMRWAQNFPNSAQQLELADFAFYCIEPTQIRFIGGFGAINWITPEDFLPPQHLIEEVEADILDHMNQDHAQNLRDYCRHYHRLEPQHALMTGIDCDGFDVIAEQKWLRFDFDQPVHDAQQARQALVAMAQKSRN